MSGWGVIPSIRVVDMPDALDFYVGHLGFSLQSDPEHPNVSIVRGDARLMLEIAADLYDDAYNAKIRDRMGSFSPNALYMEADDLVDLWAAVQKEDVSVVDPLADRPWGQAEFTVEDPFGNWLTFWKKRAAASG